MEASCSDFTFLAPEGYCTISAAYDGCQEGHDHFDCWVSGYDDYSGEQYNNSCASDF